METWIFNVKFNCMEPVYGGNDSDKVNMLFCVLSHIVYDFLNQFNKSKNLFQYAWFICFKVLDGFDWYKIIAVIVNIIHVLRK